MDIANDNKWLMKGPHVKIVDVVAGCELGQRKLSNYPLDKSSLTEN